MQINYKVNKEDLINFYNKNFYKLKKKKSLLIIETGLIIIAILLLYILLRISSYTHTFAYTILISMAIIICLFSNILLKVSYKITLKKLYSHDEYSDLFEDITLIINESKGIYVETDKSITFFDFGDVEGIYVIDGYIIINTFKQVLIPSSCFESSNEKENFLKLLCCCTDWSVCSRLPNNLIIG